MSRTPASEQPETTQGPSPPASPEEDAITCLATAIHALETRIDALEQRKDKGSFKRVTENAGAIALFLGLILTSASLYNIFVSKPEADRITRVSQFNDAVSSAAQIRQEVAQYQLQTNDPAAAMMVASAAMPRIQNNIATARVLLRSMADEDVGIPQLSVLITEAFNIGDIASANEFTRRALARRNDPPFLRSEAKRYEGKLLYATGKVDQGRQSFREAIALLGKSDMAAASRAFTLSDWILLEFIHGDCVNATAMLIEHGSALRSASVPLNVRRQLQVGLMAQLEQLRGGRCLIPTELNSLLSDRE